METVNVERVLGQLTTEQKIEVLTKLFNDIHQRLDVPPLTVVVRPQ